MARAEGRQHPDIDVILMTGSVDDQDDKLIRAIRGAAFYFIQKPFDRDVLKTLVDRCVELRHRRDENRRHVTRLEQEMAAARAFQQGLLPRSEASCPGIRISCRQTPSSELGGDLYDYACDRRRPDAPCSWPTSPATAPSAAMLTAVVKSAFRAASATTTPVGRDRARARWRGAFRLRALRDADRRHDHRRRALYQVRKCRPPCGMPVGRQRPTGSVGQHWAARIAGVTR